MGELAPGTLTEKGRDRVFVYDTVNGERSEVLVTMLQQILAKKRPDGSTVFTKVKPSGSPVRGTLKCLLHKDNPERGLFDKLGLPTCRKSNLTAAFHVRRHMEKRHRIEWETILQDRKDTAEARRIAERKEDREFQRTLMEKSAPLYVSKKDKIK